MYDASATATVTHTFPATAGTILNTGTTSFTQSLSSGTKIGTIKINGTSTDLYCQTNTDKNVLQTSLSEIDNTVRSILVSGTANTTGTKTEGTYKPTNLTWKSVDSTWIVPSFRRRGNKYSSKVYHCITGKSIV